MVNQNESLKMNTQGPEWVQLWACTQAVVVTGGPLWLNETEP